MPSVTGYTLTNDRGEVIGGSNGNGLDSLSGIGSIWNDAQNMGNQNLNNRVQMLAATGGSPGTGAEAAALQALYEKQAAGQDQQSYQQGINALMGGASGGIMGSINAPVVTGSNSHWVSTGPAQNQGYYASGGTQAGGMNAENTALQSQMVQHLTDLMNNPGMSDSTIQGMVNKGADQISEGEGSAEMGLTDAANAAGFGQSGAQQAGLRELMTSATGQKANYARDVRTEAAKDRENQLQQALGTSGQYLGRVQDNAASQARLDTQLQAEQSRQNSQFANERQMMAIQAMMNQHTAVPNYSNMIATSGMKPYSGGLGFGGGVNRSTRATPAGYGGGGYGGADGGGGAVGGGAAADNGVGNGEPLAAATGGGGAPGGGAGSGWAPQSSPFAQWDEWNKQKKNANAAGTSGGWYSGGSNEGTGGNSYGEGSSDG